MPFRPTSFACCCCSSFSVRCFIRPAVENLVKFLEGGQQRCIHSSVEIGKTTDRRFAAFRQRLIENRNRVVFLGLQEARPGEEEEKVEDKDENATVDDTTTFKTEDETVDKEKKA